MDTTGFVKEFFMNLRCTQCNTRFTEDSISVMRQESNYTVVKILCACCSKNIGIAIVGLDKESMKRAVELSNENPEIPFASSSLDSPITYDDIIDAHEFFNNLDENWMSFLPQKDN